jgi:putative tricarboxylic transport membrane protein
MEENLRRSLLISDGSFSFLWDRPLTLCIMLVIIGIIGWQIYRGLTNKNPAGVAN